MESMTRQNISSGSHLESLRGYSRAVCKGPFVFVGGMTAGSSEGAVGGDDVVAQTRETLTRVESALKEAGASIADVVRTRIFVTNISDFEAVAAVHGEVFGEVRPANALVEVGALALPDLLVEIEADAIIG
ncbi:RidA family protein (plasmid) [Arthrobacter sp. TES]|nr:MULTISPECIES: RidA family protein [Micrococcales]QOI65940.1 RidA family protein [Arthrobacter sp. TES]MCX8456829.1 RidA family protein [Paenarthrobacter ureafaciens]MCY0974437.1 RidA family protein [Paenarthrobacter ureafaciens]UOD79591.1 RidA family protein [Paenarthrobacter ureafaciens]WNZ02945.1 RidA family protein [Paenarthrobacter ureafaciens]